MSQDKNIITINNKILEFTDGQTILEVAKKYKIYIPTLCYIEGLPPYGGCRLCIVKVEGMKGYPTACTTPAQKGMKIITKDEELQELRSDVLKLILSEHPNSCIVCENKDICEKLRITKNKAGRSFGCFSCSNKENCELREIIEYLEISEIPYDLEYKNYPLKRKDPFFEMDYNLCILCGKCIRICNELRGIGAINFISRGHDVRVSTALDLLHLDTNCQFCGACVDICPTGVLTPKNTKWVEKSNNKITSICGFCSVGCGFDYFSNKYKLMESIPNKENVINNGQACMIGRFCTVPFINGKDRLKYPLIKKGNNLIPCDWNEVYKIINENMKNYKPDEIGILVSSDLSNESIYIFKEVSKLILKTDNISLISDNPLINTYYNLLKNHLDIDYLPSSFQDILKSSWILLVNTNIQLTHPVLLINLKKAKDNGKKIISLNIGDVKLPLETRRLLDYELNLSKKDSITFILFLIKNLIYSNKYTTNSISNLNEFNSSINKINIKSEDFKEIKDFIRKNIEGTIILGQYMNFSEDFSKDLIGTLLNLIILSNEQIKMIPLWRKGNIEGVYQELLLNKIKSKENILDDIKKGKIKALYLTERIEDANILKNIEFLILQDIFPSNNFQYANVILPTCTFIEDSGTIINSERRSQKFNRIIPNIGKSKPDWQIFCELAKTFNNSNTDKFQFSNSDEIQSSRQELEQDLHSKINNSVKNTSLYIPSLNKKYIETQEKRFTFESFKYRGEKIYNQVADLKELIDYRNLKNSEIEVIFKEEKLLKTEFKVVSNKEIVPNIYQMVIRAPLIAKKANPGNFIIIMKDEKNERIPMTLSDWDDKKGTITIYFEEKGYSTKELSEIKDGDYLYSVVGPLGNEIEIKKFGTVLLGGGCYGIGAIYPIVKELKLIGNKVIIILEARNKNLFYLEKEFEDIADEVIYCTSDGSKGLKGKISKGIQYAIKHNNKIDVSFFVGCKYMMMEASEITKNLKIPTFVSLNTIMIDGTGMCGGCRLSLIKDDKKITKFACVDGPTFDAHLVDWDELIERGIRFKEPEILVYQNDSCKALEKYKSSKKN